jgi:hypothetical protein
MRRPFRRIGGQLGRWLVAKNVRSNRRACRRPPKAISTSRKAWAPHVSFRRRNARLPGGRLLVTRDIAPSHRETSVRVHAVAAAIGAGLGSLMSSRSRAGTP